MNNIVLISILGILWALFCLDLSFSFSELLFCRELRISFILSAYSGKDFFWIFFWSDLYLKILFILFPFFVLLPEALKVKGDGGILNQKCLLFPLWSISLHMNVPLRDILLRVEGKKEDLNHAAVLHTFWCKNWLIVQPS